MDSCRPLCVSPTVALATTPRLPRKIMRGLSPQVRPLLARGRAYSVRAALEILDMARGLLLLQLEKLPDALFDTRCCTAPPKRAWRPQCTRVKLRIASVEASSSATTHLVQFAEFTRDLAQVVALLPALQAMGRRGLLGRTFDRCGRAPKFLFESTEDGGNVIEQLNPRQRLARGKRWILLDRGPPRVQDRCSPTNSVLRKRRTLAIPLSHRALPFRLHSETIVNRFQFALLVLIGLLSGCAGQRANPPPSRVSAPEARQMIDRALPRATADRAGWATDMYAAFTALSIEPNHENICAAAAVIGQESGFRVDPVIPICPPSRGVKSIRAQPMQVFRKFWYTARYS